MGRGEQLRALFSRRRKMKVRTKRGGFFFEGRIVASNEELDLPEDVAKSWIENDLAEEVKTAKAAQKREKEPSEDTSDAQAEGREKR
jgi:hypothetical protein